MLHREPNDDILVSLPSGIGGILTDNAPRLLTAIMDQQRSLKVWWVLSRAPDSVHLLAPVTSAFGSTAGVRIVTLRNLHYGEPGKFRRWNDDKRAQDALERVPVETQSVIDEGIIKINELIQRATSGDPLRGGHRSGSRASTPTALTLELKHLLSERSRRAEVTLAFCNYRSILVAYVLAATTVTFTSWAVSAYSPYIVPTLIAVAAFVCGVAGTAVLYELRRP